jgi:hypothetical protein
MIPAHSEIEIMKYHDYAERKGLLATGGTDWHGDFSEWNVNLGDYGIDEEKLYLLEKDRLDGLI